MKKINTLLVIGLFVLNILSTPQGIPPKTPPVHDTNSSSIVI